MRPNNNDEAAMAPYEKLKQAILRGEFAPDHPLVEQTLAQWCGVSRTPVREALRRLEQDGLIHRTAQGLVVRSRSPEEILDIYETRIVLEATASRFAAERRTDHDVRLLRWNLAHAREVEEGDEAQMLDTNQEFHMGIRRAAHNECLVDLLERLSLHLGRYRENTLMTPGRWAESLKEHEEMVDAIENRDSALAAEVATRHFAEARDIRLKLFASVHA